MKNIPRIVEMNRDKEPLVQASCFYGRHAWGVRNAGKQFAMLAVSDIHRSLDRLEAAIEYLNYHDVLDCGINLGDIQGSNFSEVDGKWYTDCILKSQKPFFTVLGNHDVGESTRAEISATSQRAFEEFILPTAPVMGDGDCTRPYYARVFDTYKLVLICMDAYDAPDARDENGDFIIDRGEILFSQAQLDWLIKTLSTIPADYHLLIALHAFPFGSSFVDCSWSQKDIFRTDGTSLYNENMQRLVRITPYGEAAPLADIVNAWKHGGALQRDYVPCNYKEILPVLHISCDFTKRGEGFFAAYLIGHHHRDAYATCDRYPDQNVIALPASALDDGQNYCSDLPRVRGTRTEDVITVVSVCTDYRQIRLVRIGSDTTFDMRKRDFFIIHY